jgi:hypothetical protein
LPMSNPMDYNAKNKSCQEGKNDKYPKRDRQISVRLEELGKEHPQKERNLCQRHISGVTLVH